MEDAAGCLCSSVCGWGFYDVTGPCGRYEAWRTPLDVCVVLYVFVDLMTSRGPCGRYEVWRTPLDARHNWWGYNETLAIQGRIKDKLDGQGLLRVDFR